jgi:hypothetical protein
MEGAFAAFQSRVRTVFGIEESDAVNHQPCWEVVFDMVEGTDAKYEFDFEHLRLSLDLLLAATLLSEWKHKRVVFLSPTSYYSAQAIRIYNRWQTARKFTTKTLTIGVLGNIPAEVLRAADVIMHHGRMYPAPAPTQHQRVIVQLFPGIDVPHDTRPLSSLVAACRSGDD